MAAKQVALSPVQWMTYFKENPETFNELVDCQLKLEKADSHDDRYEPLKAGCEVLQPKLDELAKFQEEFTRRTVGHTTTEQEMREELVHTLRGDATAVARRTGAKSMAEYSEARRSELKAKPDVSKMTPEEAKKAMADWEAERQAAIAEANRGEGHVEAANAMAEDMNRSLNIDKINAIIQLANRILQFLTQLNPTPTPAH